MRLFITCILASLVVACATPHMPAGRAFEQAQAAPKGLARLYIFRPGFTKALSDEAPTLSFDGAVRSTLPSSRYIDLTVSPGPHVIALEPQTLESSTWHTQASFDAIPDTIYYLAIWNTTEAEHQLISWAIPVPVTVARDAGVRIEFIQESEAIPVLRTLSSVEP